jgi:uncharacterized membrane protein YgcG
MHLSRRSLLPILLLCWLIPAHPAWAVYPPPVKDEGKFFSKDALDKADKKIKEIYDRFHKDVVVETFPSIPADLEAKYRELGRKKFFVDWAQTRARNLGVNGIYILVTREPSHLQVEVGHRTEQKAFTLEDRDRLARGLLAKFKEKKFDDGLLEGLDFIEKNMKADTSK